MDKQELTAIIDLAPRLQNLLDLIGDFAARSHAVYSARKHLVVAGVLVSNRCPYRHNQGFVLQIAAGLSPAHSPASPLRGVFGNGGKFMSRAAGE